MDVKPGQIIGGRYRVVKLVGSGGVGSVYEAENTMLRKPVALKVMSGLETSPTALARFMREGPTASRIGHPGIVEVFDAGEHEGLPWIAMELLEGETLEARLEREGRLSLVETLEVAKGVLDALAAVHERGIVHRDLKPGNIFLEQTPRGLCPRLLDFGLAKRLEDSGLTTTGIVLGTAAYLAPEQALDSKRVDARTDLFAIGLVLYECLAGVLPYEAKSVPEMVSKLLTEEPRDLGSAAPDVPEYLVAVVRRCLSREPDGRYQSAAALLEALDALPQSSASPTMATDAETTLEKADEEPACVPQRERPPPTLIVSGPARSAPVGSSSSAAVASPGAAPYPLPAAPTGPHAGRDGVDTALKAVIWVAVGIALLVVLGIVGSVFLFSMLVSAQ